MNVGGIGLGSAVEIRPIPLHSNISGLCNLIIGVPVSSILARDTPHTRQGKGMTSCRIIDFVSDSHFRATNILI